MHLLYYQLFRFRLPALFPCSFPPIDFIGPFLSSLLFLSFRLLDSPARSSVCASFFCEEAPTPRMVTSRSAGSTGSSGARRRLASRRLGLRRGRLGQSSTTQQREAHDELVQLVHSCLAAHLLTQEAALLPLAQALLACLLPSGFPLISTHSGAQRQHRIDMRALPAHASPFESCLNDPIVGAFHTATAKGPPQSLIVGILHLLFTLAQVADLLVEISDVGMPV
jgi:hypothetical protein